LGYACNFKHPQLGGYQKQGTEPIVMCFYTILR
jgi:hypothetical protein